MRYYDFWIFIGSYCEGIKVGSLKMTLKSSRFKVKQTQTSQKICLRDICNVFTRNKLIGHKFCNPIP